MTRRRERPIDTYELLPGVLVLPPGLLLLAQTTTLIAAGAGAESLAALFAIVEQTRARELVLLGGDGAGDLVPALRDAIAVTLVATADVLEREGWLLVNGDDAHAGSLRRIAGHLRPSLPLARGESVPVFLANPSLIVLPALASHAPGLNVVSPDCERALQAFATTPDSFEVIAATASRVYSVGSLAGLRGALAARPAGATRRSGPHARRSR